MSPRAPRRQPARGRVTAALVIAATLGLAAAGCGSGTAHPGTQVPSPSAARTPASPRPGGTSGAPGSSPAVPPSRPTSPAATVSSGAVFQASTLVVNGPAAASLTLAFRQLSAAGFPIRQMRVVDDFGGDDERSRLADNTSAFNCRLVPGTGVWAQHAYGLAVDINPMENPEIQNGKADPPAAAAWADRSRSSPAMIRDGDAVWRAFRSIGWSWGGDWRSLKDYMHFSANGL